MAKRWQETEKNKPSAETVKRWNGKAVKRDETVKTDTATILRRGRSLHRSHDGSLPEPFSYLFIIWFVCLLYVSVLLNIIMYWCMCWFMYLFVYLFAWWEPDRVVFVLTTFVLRIPHRPGRYLLLKPMLEILRFAPFAWWEPARVAAVSKSSVRSYVYVKMYRHVYIYI